MLNEERIRHFSLLRHLAPAVLVLATFLVAFGLGAVLVVQAIDAAHAQRERQMLQAALDIQLAQLEAIAQDNATSDWVALAVRETPFDRRGIELTWREYTERADIYSGVFVLDRNGHVRVGLVRGRVIPPDHDRSWTPAIRGMRQRYGDGHGTRSGLISFRDKVTLVAVAEVRPHSRTYRGPSGPPTLMAFTKQFNASVLEQLNNSLQLDGLRLAPSGAVAPPGQTVLLLRDVAGDPIGALLWSPRHPGLAALLGQAPILVAILTLCLGVTVLVGWTNVRAAGRLADAAYRDSLSRLPNRRRFARVLDRSFGRGQELVVALLDLDGFKAVNDEHGHAIGDALIQDIARRLLATVPAEAFVARLGGDEFALILTGSGCDERMEQAVERLLAGLQSFVDLNGRRLTVSASIGLASDMGVDDANELLRRADLALYDAKGNGKGQMRWYDADLDRRLMAEQALGKEMRQAFGSDAFQVVYQPIVDSHDRRIVTVEALLRFEGSAGPVCPSIFIPVAEQSGLIDDLGFFVLDQALADIAPWPGVRVAVNVSGAQLRDRRFADHVAAILARHAVDPNRLELEITESWLVSDPEHASAALRRLQSIGVSLSLDDFGTGFASIGFLRRFAFDQLKLDRSLVSGVLAPGSSTKLVEASVAIARALHMVVVAEGVETADVAAAMHRLGCDRMQGWYFGRPVPRDVLAATLAQSREGRLLALVG